ncbi:MAG: epimerase [Planctomycetota bacterium]
MEHSGRIVIAGGTGQLGRMLARHWAAAGPAVVVLARPASAAAAVAAVPAASGRGCVRTVAWDAGAAAAGGALGAWAGELDGADVVVGLAGRSVDCRYSAANRTAIVQSRVDSMRAVAAAIAAAARPPRVWLQASTATIYAHHTGGPNTPAHDEANGVLGGDEPGAPDTWRFSIDVARRWEAAATERPLPATRTVLLRSAMVMSPDRGGVFDVLLRLTRFWLGGTCGDGRQYVSWIHGDDFVRALEFCVAHAELAGPVNVASPAPLPQAEFARLLRRAWGTRVGLPATRWMLEVGAFFLRTETELILKSRRVVPGRLLAAGFRFAHPDWAAAAVDLVARWRATSLSGSV